MDSVQVLSADYFLLPIAAGRSTMSGSNNFVDFESTSVPFTYRFLGLRLRLAFTKRRFKRVEDTFQQHLTGPAGTEELTDMMESTFSTLRDEIKRIEKGHDRMKKKALPKVREQILLHKSFLCFLGGFRVREGRPPPNEKHEQERREQKDATRGEDAHAQWGPADTKDEEKREEETLETKEQQHVERCLLSMLNQGEETTTAIKRHIAEFAGVPIGMMIHDLRSLEALLEQSDEAFGPSTAELRRSGGS